jgi:hypothetical protein
MATLKRIYFASALVFALLSTAAAQDSATPQRSFPTITAAASGERVRIAAPASIVQMHLEVYAAGGEKLFDQEIRGGNVFDWHLQDGQGQRLAAGSYVCVVTAKSISGKLTQKIGTVNVAEKTASVQPAASLSVPQAQNIGPVEDNSSWTIAGNEPETTTVIAHDGTDGQMIRGRGALSFRIGSFFSGVDTEQMRLTESGRLGIGTSNPQAKLDVAGTIRAERFLVVKPKSARADKTATSTPTADAVDPGQSLISGTGTQDRVAKWIDNSGTLGDSSITDTGGFVGIGTTTPGSKLVVSANSATLPPATGVARFADADGVQTSVFADAFGTNPIFNVRRANGTAASPSAVQASQVLGVIGASGYGASAYMGTRARVGFFASENWTNTANGTFLTFNTTANGAATPGGSERMRIDNAGNVGIGTTGASSKLDVAGDINTSTQYNIGGSRILSDPGDNNLFLGLSAGAANSSGSLNSFFGQTAGASNTIGVSNSFFGKSAGFTNTKGNLNSFFGEGAGGLSDVGSENSFFGEGAGFVTTGSSNSFFGRSAGLNNSSGSKNTAIGVNADVTTSFAVTNATAIGADAIVSKSNSVVLGNSANVGIGTSSPNARLHVSVTDGSILFGDAGCSAGFPGLGFGTSLTGCSNYSMIGNGTDTILNRASGGALAFRENNVNQMSIATGGLVTINSLTASAAVCTNATKQLVTCASSLRYKTEVRSFSGGLNIVNHLRPIYFTWKRDGTRDIGLGAEEVEKVEPLLTFRNDKGEIEGVRYNQLSAVFINAFKEQQAQIQQQQETIQQQSAQIRQQQVGLSQQRLQITEQQQQLDAVKLLVCRSHTRAKVCR